MKTEHFNSFVRELYQSKDAFIPLHTPLFIGNEKKYLEDCIDSTFVSSVGPYVDLFEDKMSEFTQTKRSVAVVCISMPGYLHNCIIFCIVGEGDGRGVMCFFG